MPRFALCLTPYNERRTWEARKTMDLENNELKWNIQEEGVKFPDSMSSTTECHNKIVISHKNRFENPRLTFHCRVTLFLRSHFPSWFVVMATSMNPGMPRNPVVTFWTIVEWESVRKYRSRFPARRNYNYKKKKWSGNFHSIRVWDVSRENWEIIYKTFQIVDKFVAFIKKSNPTIFSYSYLNETINNNKKKSHVRMQ